MPRTGAPPTMGDRPMTGAAVERTAAATPGTARIVPTLTTGWLGGELAADAEGLCLTPPAALGGDPAAERVHDRVEIRTDAQAEHRDVVAVVSDDRDVMAELAQAEQEAGATDPARQHRHAHARH